MIIDSHPSIHQSLDTVPGEKEYSQLHSLGTGIKNIHRHVATYAQVPQLCPYQVHKESKVWKSVLVIQSFLHAWK